MEESAARSRPTGSRPVVTKTEGCFAKRLCPFWVTLSRDGGAAAGRLLRRVGIVLGGWESSHAQGIGSLHRGSASLCTDKPDTESSTVCYVKSILLLHR